MLVLGPVIETESGFPEVLLIFTEIVTLDIVVFLQMLDRDVFKIYFFLAGFLATSSRCQSLRTGISDFSIMRMIM
jgi:hypothetical protein